MKSLTIQQKLRIAAIRPDISAIIAHHETLKSLHLSKGDKGDQGLPGKNGIDGRHGQNGKDGKDGNHGKDGRDGLDGRDGKDGKDAVINYAKILSDLKQQIKDGKDGKDAVIDEGMIKKALAPHVKELHTAIARSMDGMPRGSNYGGFIETGLKDSTGKPLSKDGSGSWIIPSQGSSSGTPVDNEVVSGSGMSWTLANTPIAGSVKLYGLGQRLTLTTDYSISGANITTVSTWSSGNLLADYRM